MFCYRRSLETIESVLHSSLCFMIDPSLSVKRSHQPEKRKTNCCKEHPADKSTCADALLINSPAVVELAIPLGPKVKFTPCHVKRAIARAAKTSPVYPSAVNRICHVAMLTVFTQFATVSARFISRRRLTLSEPGHSTQNLGLIVFWCASGRGTNPFRNIDMEQSTVLT